MYETHKSHVDHEIFDRDTFDMIPVLRRLKGKAIKQMGTSGGGNHFVEFGEIEITEEDEQIRLPKGKYLGILSHSGSRRIRSRNRPVIIPELRQNSVLYQKKLNNLHGWI